MSEPINPATRPSRLSVIAHILVVGLLLASFVSGLLVWWGQTIQFQQSVTPVWLRPCLVVHGGLNPILCGIFGYLCCQHIRLGWQLRANLVTGFGMEAVFALQILTGVGLYYVGADGWREGLVWTHRIAGLLFPVALAAHWEFARRWVKKISN